MKTFLISLLLIMMRFQGLSAQNYSEGTVQLSYTFNGEFQSKFYRLTGIVYDNSSTSTFIVAPYGPLKDLIKTYKKDSGLHDSIFVEQLNQKGKKSFKIKNLIYSEENYIVVIELELIPVKEIPARFVPVTSTNSYLNVYTTGLQHSQTLFFQSDGLANDSLQVFMSEFESKWLYDERGILKIAYTEDQSLDDVSRGGVVLGENNSFIGMLVEVLMIPDLSGSVRNSPSPYKVGGFFYVQRDKIDTLFVSYFNKGKE